MSEVARSAGLLTLILSLAGSANAGSIVADFTTLGTVNAPSVSVGGTTVTVTGSANVTAGLDSSLGSTGLGIFGGGSNASVDPGETLTIDYGQLVKDVTLTVFDIPPSSGNVIYQFQAFNGATSLGFFAIPIHVQSRETKDLSALAGGLEFSRVALSILATPATMGLVIEGTTYDLAAATAVPEPGSWLIAASGLVPVLGVTWHRRKVRRTVAA